MRTTCLIAVLMSVTSTNTLPAAHSNALGQEPAPAALKVVSANIDDVVPINRPIARREVRFSIRLASAPTCAAGSRGEYGFLIDADKSAKSGVAIPGLEPLGVDARIVMRCDEATGRFVSPTGRVVPIVDQRSPGLDLVTTVGQLPSVEFFWAPYAATAGQLSLIAGTRRYSTWAIPERSIP